MKEEKREEDNLVCWTKTKVQLASKTISLQLQEKCPEDKTMEELYLIHRCSPTSNNFLLKDFLI